MGSSDLLQKISRDNLYAKLLAQLNKDFQLAGLVNEFQLSLPAEELSSELKSIVYDLMHHKFSDYLNLLYRVDVSEAQIKQMSGSDTEELSEQVSFLILKRECQKVWFKAKLFRD